MFKEKDETSLFCGRAYVCVKQGNANEQVLNKLELLYSSSLLLIQKQQSNNHPIVMQTSQLQLH